MVGGRTIGFLSRMDVRLIVMAGVECPSRAWTVLTFRPAWMSAVALGCAPGAAGRQSFHPGSAHDLPHPQRQALR